MSTTNHNDDEMKNNEMETKKGKKDKKSSEGGKKDKSAEGGKKDKSAAAAVPGSDSKAPGIELEPWPTYIKDRLDLWEKYMARRVHYFYTVKSNVARF